MRLQKFMADCGVDSRRKCEEIIAAGRVKVNGQTIKQMGYEVDTHTDTVEVDDDIIRPAAQHVYIALNKPYGYITSMDEQFGRPCVAEFFEKKNLRVFPVGRLDYDSEGLLLMTNDGNLSFRLAHPKFHIEKTYTARIRGSLDKKTVSTLENGIVIDGRKTAPARIKVLDENGPNAIVRVVIHEGRNRQIRRMFESVGCKVDFLRRDSMGSIKLGELPVGRWRHLSSAEVEYLFRAAGLNE